MHVNNDIKSSYLLGRIILLILRVNVYLKYFMFKGYSVEGGGRGVQDGGDTCIPVADTY